MVVGENKTMMSVPREPHEGGSGFFHDANLRYAASQLEERLVVIGNGPVMALAANGGYEDVQADVRRAKSEARGNQPLGLTVPFEQFLPYVNLESITNEQIRELMANAAAMTARLGALAFLRAQAKQGLTESLPACILPVDGGSIQGYSPEGNARTEFFIDLAQGHGVKFPVMTSVNKTGNPEIVSNDTARQFATESSLLFVPNPRQSDEAAKPKGSYPVVELQPDAKAFMIVRDGFLGEGMIEALLDGFPVERPATRRTTNYPEGVLNFEDLQPDERELKGPELRQALLPYIGGLATVDEVL